jgi:hypothetical protein
MVSAASHLRTILQHETSGRISLNSFIGQYLLIIDFPSDVQEALSDGQVNFQEAAQLARLTPERLGCQPAEARRTRNELLQAQTAVQGAQTRLRARVKELLGEAQGAAVSSEGMAAVVAKVDEMLEIDPTDTQHMFWEEMRRLFFAVDSCKSRIRRRCRPLNHWLLHSVKMTFARGLMKEIEPEDLDEEMMNDFLQAMDGVSNVLYRIELRWRKRVKPSQELSP